MLYFLPTESSEIALFKMWEDGYRNIVNIDVRLIVQPVCLLIFKHARSVLRSCDKANARTSSRITTRDVM